LGVTLRVRALAYGRVTLRLAGFTASIAIATYRGLCRLHKRPLYRSVHPACCVRADIKVSDDFRENPPRRISLNLEPMLQHRLHGDCAVVPLAFKEAARTVEPCAPATVSLRHNARRIEA